MKAVATLAVLALSLWCTATEETIQLPFVSAHPDAPTFDQRAIGDGEFAKRRMAFGIPIYAAPGVPDWASRCAILSGTARMRRIWIPPCV